MLTVIGLKKLTKFYQDEFSLGITRGFRFLSNLFLTRYATLVTPTLSLRWIKRVTGENGSFGRTNSLPKILIALIIC
jgi:hypothetical protein